MNFFIISKERKRSKLGFPRQLRMNQQQITENLSCSLVFVDGSSYLFGFCANSGYWLITHLIVDKYLVLILTIFGLLLNFIYLQFFGGFFHWFLIDFVVLSAFVFSFFLDYIILFELQKRGGFSRNIRFLCFLQYFRLAFKNPIFDRLIFL